MKPSLPGTIIRVMISFGALGVIIYCLRDKLGEAFQILRSDVSWGWFVFALALFFIALMLQAIRIQRIFRIQNVIMSYKEAVYLNFLALFFNLFFPSAVGGDIAKAFYAYKHSGKKIESLTSVFFDRLLGFVALIILALVAVLILSKELNDPHIDQVVYGFLFLMLLVVVFFGSKRFARLFKFVGGWVRSEKWKNRLKDVYHAIYGYKNHKILLFFLILLSFGCHFLYIVMHVWLAKSLDIHMSFWLFFVLVPVTTIVSMAPSLGGLGVREAGLIYLFSRFIPSERALVLSILVDMVIYGFSLFAGVIYSFRGGLKSKVIHEMEELQ